MQKKILEIRNLVLVSEKNKSRMKMLGSKVVFDLSRKLIIAERSRKGEVIFERKRQEEKLLLKSC